MWKKLKGLYEAAKWIVAETLDQILKPRSR
jgi:hypothetical protein